MSRYGKNINYVMDDLNQTRGGNCTLGCSMGCTEAAIHLCKCKNGQSESKGSSYYPERNDYIAVMREPTTG